MNDYYIRGSEECAFEEVGRSEGETHSA